MYYFRLLSFSLLASLSTQDSWAQATNPNEKTLADIGNIIKHSICDCAKSNTNIYMSRPQIDTIVATCYEVGVQNALDKGWLNEKYIENVQLLQPMESNISRWLGDSCQSLISLLQRDLMISAGNQYFIPAKNLEKDFGLSLPKGNAGFRMWTNKAIAAGQKDVQLQVVIDIRWVFDSHQKALDFHKASLKYNAEGGVTNPEKINLKGAQELYCYREGAPAQAVFKSLGIEQRHHYFLFVFDKTVVKVFVGTNNTCSSKKAAKFAKMAIKQLKTIK
jgi:hypothetical protein